MLGHVGINVPDLDAARRYYSAVMPLVGFEICLDADDEFAYRPMAGKPGTYLFFYPSTRATKFVVPIQSGRRFRYELPKFSIGSVRLRLGSIDKAAFVEPTTRRSQK